MEAPAATAVDRTVERSRALRQREAAEANGGREALEGSGPAVGDAGLAARSAAEATVGAGWDEERGATGVGHLQKNRFAPIKGSFTTTMVITSQVKESMGK